jgi:hypothetical protein
LVTTVLEVDTITSVSLVVALFFTGFTTVVISLLLALQVFLLRYYLRFGFKGGFVTITGFVALKLSK